MNAEHMESQPAGERVEHPARILTLLTRIQREGRFVTVTVPGAPQRYNSTLLGVESENGHFWLEGLTPPDGHQHVAEAGTVDVYARLDNANVHFKAKVADTVQEDKAVIYRLPFPDAVDYAQRRAHYRVKVGLGRALPLVLPLDQSQRLEGRLRDLSLGGVGALLNGQGQLSPGEVVEQCTLRLPRVGELTCDLEVRYIAEEGTDGKRLGGRFVELAPPQRRQLERVIAELERELLRKRPRG